MRDGGAGRCKSQNYPGLPLLWWIRSLGRDILTENDIFLMKNQSIVLLHEESGIDRSVILPLAA